MDTSIISLLSLLLLTAVAVSGLFYLILRLSLAPIVLQVQSIKDRLDEVSTDVKEMQKEFSQLKIDVSSLKQEVQQVKSNSVSSLSIVAGIRSRSVPQVVADSNKDFESDSD